MSDAGQRIMSGGLALAGLMRQQRRDALDEQKTEDERQINIYASKLMQADDFQSGLKDIPEEYQASAFQKAMTNAQSMIQADTQYQQNMKAKSEQSFRDFQNKQRMVDAFLDRRDYKAAAPLLEDIYNNHIKDGQTVEISWGDEKAQQPSMRFSNKYTNSTVEKPMTEEDVKGAADFTRQLSMSQDDFNALRQRDSESWSLFNQKQRADMQTATDDKGNSIQVFQQVPRASDGSFDPDQLQWIQWVPGKGPSRLPNGLPEGYKLVSHQKETADLTRAQADAETAKSQQVIAEENAKVAPVIGGARQAEARYNQDLYQAKQQAILTPDLSTTVETSSGSYAKTPANGYVKVPDDMAPLKKVHMLGGGTNAETGEQTFFAQEDPYKAKVFAVGAGVKTGKVKTEDPMVYVPDPNGGEPQPMKSSQALTELKTISSFLSQSGNRTAGEALAALANSDGGEIPGKENKIRQIVALSKDSSQPEAQQWAQRALALAAGLKWMTSGKSKSSATAKKMFDKYSGGLN